MWKHLLAVNPVSGWVIHSFRCDAIASPSFAGLLIIEIQIQWQANSSFWPGGSIAPIPRSRFSIKKNWSSCNPIILQSYNPAILWSCNLIKVFRNKCFVCVRLINFEWCSRSSPLQSSFSWFGKFIDIGHSLLKSGRKSVRLEACARGGGRLKSLGSGRGSPGMQIWR